MGVSIFNTGYDLQDQIDAAESAIAIVSVGDTHVAITSGQYVYVREHGTLAEGLYKATSNIAANATLSSSNVTAVSGGGLNALNSNLAKVITTNNVINLTTYTAKTLIEMAVNAGCKLYYCSATGANKLSDLPIVQAGLYIVYTDSYYKKLFFTGTDGREYRYDYDTNTWASITPTKQETITLQTQTKYAISTNYVYRTGNVVIVQLDVTCNTPESSSPGELVVNGLPGAKNNFYLTIAPRLDRAAESIRAVVMTDGSLYLRYGSTNAIYDICLVYVTA